MGNMNKEQIALRGIRESLNKWFDEVDDFNLYDKLSEKSEDADWDYDLIYDLPYTSTTDKNGLYYIGLAILGKEDGKLVCIETGEDYGNKWYINIGEVEVETLAYLKGLWEENYGGA